MFESLGTLAVVFYLFCLFILILWFLMPFAVFGLKARIDETNRLLRNVVTAIERLEDVGRK